MPISFAVGKAINVSGSEEVQAVTDQLRTTLQQLIDTLQTTYPEDGTGQWWHPRHLGGTAPTPQAAAAADAERDRRRDQAADRT